MKLLLCFVMLYHYVYSNDNYIELGDNLRVGNDFLDQLKKDITIRALEPPHDNEVSAHDGIPNTQKIEFKVTKEMREFMVEIAKGGVNEFTYIGRYLQRKLKLCDDFMTKIDYVINDYEKKFKNYTNYALRAKVKSHIDFEYLFLDIIATLNLVMHSEEKKILKMVTDGKEHNVTKTEVQIVTDIVYKTRFSHLKEEMDYLCHKINICRPYPGFCEYFSELIGVILKLSDDKLLNLINYVKQKMKDRINLFQALIKENVLEIMALKLGALSKDLPNAKELLVGLRLIITARYKSMKTSDVELKIRTKAVRILLDIIDKAFSKQLDELTPITLDMTAKALNQLQKGVRNNVDMPIKLFFEHIVAVLRQSLDSDTIEEVLTLTEVMMLGKSDDKGFTKLFTEGSASL